MAIIVQGNISRSTFYQTFLFSPEKFFSFC